jgi:Fe-S-cluster containining protein
MDYEVDYSEVAGRKVGCPDGCGLCCLCQPEVLPRERGFFRENYPKDLVKSRTEDRYWALALKKGKGSCVFLDECRRCKVYDHRTTYCRQFPYHIYVSDRVKVELDLSCRGVWDSCDGNNAMSEAKLLVDNAGERISQAISEAREVYRQFYANCKEAGVMSDPSMLRMAVSENLSNFAGLGFLSKVMDMCEIEPSVTLNGVQREAKLEMGDLEDAARETAMDSMASDDPFSVPVYCGRNWDWNVFMADGETLEWMILDGEGEFHHKAFANARDIHLSPLDPGGAKVLADYISILNGRDSFMGSVFSMMDENNYEDDMANAYYGSLATSILDLMWRASMLDHFLGTGMGAEGMKEAIIFYDMDRLDAPAIGAFV